MHGLHACVCLCVVALNVWTSKDQYQFGCARVSLSAARPLYVSKQCWINELLPSAAHWKFDVICFALKLILFPLALLCSEHR